MVGKSAFPVAVILLALILAYAFVVLKSVNPWLAAIAVGH